MAIARGKSGSHELALEACRTLEQKPTIDIVKQLQLDEGAENNTSVDLANGYVRRELKSRHVQFIAIGGAIGTGLFLGIGRALIQAGPLSLLIGYTVTGVAVYGMMSCLGEMVTWLPLPGAIPQFCSRYLNSSLGFAMGWNLWYSSVVIMCAEISAASVVIQYWPNAAGINVAAWVSIFLVLLILLNIIAVAVYGEAEFLFASIKILTIIGLIILCVIIDLGGVPGQDRLGFRYWRNPGAMNSYKTSGSLGRFLGLWSTLTNAAFSYNGVEITAVAAGEAENPRKNVPKAVKRVFWRILLFYVLGSLAIGLTVPYNDQHLIDANKHNAAGAARSPWVIAIDRAGIKVLPSIINAVIISSAASSGNSLLYVGSRYLFAMAQDGHAPKVFLKCSRRGVPYYAVLFTAIFSCLTYLSCSKGGASTAFTWFQNIATLSSLIVWWAIVFAYNRFYKALAVRGIDRKTLHYKSPLQPYLAWATLAYFTLVIIFSGFYAFMPWSAEDFVTSYVALPAVICLYVFWKVFSRTRLLSPEDIDIYTGKAALDTAEGLWPEPIARNLMERFWQWLV